MKAAIFCKGTSNCQNLNYVSIFSIFVIRVVDDLQGLGRVEDVVLWVVVK
jgi:hypothetical protein